MDESRRLAMRRAHTKHQGFCTCGKIVCGNGGLYNHSEMHRRRGDGHRFLIPDAWLKLFDRVGSKGIAKQKS